MKKSILLYMLCNAQNLFGAAGAQQCNKRPDVGFVRRKNGEIEIVAYHPHESIAAQLIDARREDSPNSTEPAEPSQAFVEATLIKAFPAEPSCRETTTLCAYDDAAERTMRLADSGEHMRLDVSQTLYTKPLNEEFAQYSKKQNGITLQVEKAHGGTRLAQHHSSNCYALYNGYNSLKSDRIVLPFTETDHATVDDCGFWLVAAEGNFVNLYPLNDFGVDKKTTTEESKGLLIASIYKPELTGKVQSKQLPGLRLHTKSDDDKDAFIFSFAITRGTEAYNKKIATISPRAVTLWYPAGHSDNPEAYGKVIAEAKLDVDTPLDQLSCFNSAVFSAKGTCLYISGSNAVSRYLCEEGTFESFPYTSLFSLSGRRPIALSPDEKILAIADPQAGVTVFSTSTMKPLCTFLQGLYCTLLSCGPHGTIATSVLCEDGTSQDSLWELRRPKKRTTTPAASTPTEQSSGSWWCPTQ